MSRADTFYVVLTVLVVLLGLAVLVLSLNGNCEAACTEQYGPAYTYRVHEEGICDCIGPDGEIKAPR